MAGADPMQQPSLCELLDRVLHQGVFATGELVISVADVELVFVGLQLTLASVDTARGLKLTLEPRP